jgi:hypothetical protein
MRREPASARLSRFPFVWSLTFGHSVPVAGSCSTGELSLDGPNSWGAASVDISSASSTGSLSFDAESGSAGVVDVAVSVFGLASSADKPPCDSTPPRSEAPAAAPSFNNDLNWSSVTHVAPTHSLSVHFASKELGDAGGRVGKPRLCHANACKLG